MRYMGHTGLHIIIVLMLCSVKPGVGRAKLIAVLMFAISEARAMRCQQ